MADETQQAGKKKYLVFLPRTDFPMKADLPQREPKRLERWKAVGLYARIEARRRADNAAGKGRGRRILHDGPPYANGGLHMGHALNKILKDLVVKTSWMEGFESPYIPGWDCHGLPIEHAVEKDLGPKRRELSRAEFLQRCRAYAQKWIDTQRAGFQRLGVIGDWERPYVTMEPAYEAAVVRQLGKLFERGCVTRRLKVVHWSYGARTALAEAEVEYADKTSPAVTVAFPVPDAEARRLGLPLNLFLPIWTTTPWTLPSNRAIAMHPDLEYAVVKAGERHFAVAVPLLEDFGKQLGTVLHTVKIMKGSEFQTLVARHPWIDRESPVLLGGHVTADAGTGLVHTAPDHGVDDFHLAQHLGLFQLVGPDGKFLPAVDDPELEGINIFEANALVIGKLRAAGALLREDKLTHSYPHCWRTKTPILFRATEQWFITMDDAIEGGSSLRELGLEGVESTSWVPAAGRNRIHAMIAGRPDWCISRQRAWGTPITVLRCTACEEPLVHPSIFEKAAAAIEKGGIEAWSDMAVEDLLPSGSACAKCDGRDFQKETDILDVWIDSGVSAGVVCDTHPDLSRADYGQFIYLEGSDQHRGWFHSSLLFNLAASGTKPYTTVVTHGFVLDGRGQKMSKSLGNVITPEEILKTYGADILRLWAASCDYSEDVRVSKEILERSADAYRKIRNTLRFMMGALADYDAASAVPDEAFTALDRWLLGALARLSGEVRRAYAAFDFHGAAQALLGFCQLELSGRYFEIVKDRLYCDALDAPRRRACQATLHRAASALIRLLAPVLSFTADEAWEHLPGAADPVFTARFEDLQAVAETPDWTGFWALREMMQGELEPLRAAKTVGTSLDARVKLHLPPGEIASLRALAGAPGADSLEDLFVVSGLELVDGGELKVVVEAHEGTKCPRCWNRRGGHGRGEDADLCARCAQVVIA
ncbi:MAG TPA: isoleucine--tRNA ligase [Holophagaceae bacterium]|nr:isoleucine--tRNA ligase [Holophagaceae bacterium]